MNATFLVCLTRDQAVSGLNVTAEAWFPFSTCPCGIRGEQSGIGTGSSPSTLVYPINYHSTIASCSLSDTVNPLSVKYTVA